MKTKIINAAMLKSVRELVDFINQYEIQKQDIASVLKDGATYVLLYYRESED